jgi:zinc finger CCHC domain-containing protein 9
MTRVTSFGIKRTYLEAGFSNDEIPSQETAISPGGEQSSAGSHDPIASSEAAPPKKKRKRTPKSKRDGNLAKNADENRNETKDNDSLKRGTEDDPVESGTIAPTTGKSTKRNKRNKERKKKGRFFLKHNSLHT